MQKYNHLEIEKKWQYSWAEAGIFNTPELNEGDQKAYILDMFPYPSGNGLHVGHILGYTGSDILARQARMLGKKVLHPMGWDAFGLPAENYAIKSGVHPSISTNKNILVFKEQINKTGLSYDWDREINTSDKSYYKWTQWLFGILYKKGLAYRKEGMVNWCPSCQTVLANEQVVSGTCERCGSVVTQKKLNQWYFKITDYAERLLNDLEDLDWPDKIKSMQRNWIGRSEGASVKFKLENNDDKVEVFTTRVDTIFGATYLVLAPEHPLVSKITTSAQQAEINAYIKETSEKTELERSFLDRQKTGAFTGSFAINPANGNSIPIWIADYVIVTYGTGAIMAVPAHDERDYEFALKFKLPITQVLEGDKLPILDKLNMINSAEFNGMTPKQAFAGILEKVNGQAKITYKLRDWLVSRQRFWGSPIPIVYDEVGNEKLLETDNLPVELPLDAEFLPSGQSPLALAKDWKIFTDQNGKKYTREVDTLDTFICSSWYFLRYANPNNDQLAFDPQEIKKWLPVDTYIGGAEHAVMHLLYARFITKVLFDEGLVNFNEPFKRLKNQGLILGPDHNKMSKSKGNVINPDDVILEFGADTLRVYEMFMAPFELEKPWSVTGINGIRRFLEKVVRLTEKVQERAENEIELKLINKLIRKVTEDIEQLKFNTAVASMMEAVNTLQANDSIALNIFKTFIVLLNPFAPHLTEEIWQEFDGEGFCSITNWPSYDPSLIIDATVEYPIQINGKVRDKIVVSSDLSENEIIKLALQSSKVIGWLDGKNILKQIFIPNKLVSFVTD